MTKMGGRWTLIDKIRGHLGKQSCTVREGLDKHKIPRMRGSSLEAQKG